MRIAIAQMNSHLGDFDHNVKKTIGFCQKAFDKDCQLIIFPELNIFGYHPQDLPERPDLIEAQYKAIEDLLKRIPEGLLCLIGAVTKNFLRGKPFFNSALLVEKGKIINQFNKELLPVYDVFDDSRHFSCGKIVQNQFSFRGKKIQVLVCEDMWGWDDLYEQNPLFSVGSDKVDLVVNLSASPFTLSKHEKRLLFAGKTVKKLKAPLVYVNMVGAQDELIFDGGSFALSDGGRLLAQSPHFEEDFNIVDLSRTSLFENSDFSENKTEQLLKALVLGIRDFVFKLGFKKVHLGLSGGIDSALTACLLAQAVGAENVTALALPTVFNSPKSFDMASELAKNIGCRFYHLSIQESYEKLIGAYENCFGQKEFSILHENIQARLRGLFLMAYGNENGSLLIATGNKSEFATGYCTLYGDLCGALAPLGDLLKSQIYELTEYINQGRDIIPRGIIDRPPSAELRNHQKDSDFLPDYSVLDPVIDKLVCERQLPSSPMDQWLLKQLYHSEFKRRQSPPVLKVSDRAFGQGRRIPIVHGKIPAV